MTKISEEFIQQLVHRVRLQVSTNELHALGQQLNAIVAYVDSLQEVSVEELSCDYEVHPSAIELREDVLEERDVFGDRFVARSLGAEDRLYRVPQILPRKEKS